MNIESNNEILSFTHALMKSDYDVQTASEEHKRRYFIARRNENYYMIELGALGTDEDGYGIYRIKNPTERERISNIVPISEFDPASGIRV